MPLYFYLEIKNLETGGYSMSAKYRRILLKLSGEALMGDNDFGIDPVILKQLAEELVNVQQSGVQIGLVIGGGNIFRGAGLAKSGIDRVKGDQMGMLATVMNALAMQDACQKLGASCEVLSSFRLDQACGLYSAHKARHFLENGSIVICSAGTGNPYFTTDTAASLRALEIEADLMLKGTKVDGIYTADPKKDKNATRYETLNYNEAISKELGVMDLTAMVLCRDNQLPMCVYNLFNTGSLTSIINGEPVGTMVEV